MIKRILQINESSAVFGGSEQHVHDLCAGLKTQGHQVKTFYPGDITVKQGKEMISAHLALLLDDFKPDIVHVHSLRHKHLWMLEFIGKSGYPMVQTWHAHKAFCLNGNLCNNHDEYCERCRGGKYWHAVGCVDLPLALTTYVNRTLLCKDPLRHVQSIITPSRYLMQKAVEWGIRKSIQPIYNFARLPGRIPLSRREPDLIVFSGRLSKLKGIRILFEAVREMNCRLLILGDGELRDDVKEYMDSSPPGKVLWPGYCSGEEYWRQLSRGSVLVLPALCPENCPLTIIDAFALGIPAVGTALGGVSELVGDKGERGVLVPPHDVEALRTALTFMLENEETSRIRGEAGRRFISENMTWDRYYASLIKCYADAIQMMK